MSFPRLASIFSFAGVVALTYIASADPQLNTVATSMKSTGFTGRALDQGSWKIGGSAGYSSFANVMYLAPAAHYFVVDRLSLGMDAELGFYDWRITNRSLRPTVSYYFLKGEEFAAFLKQDIGYNTYRFENYGASYETNFVDARTFLGFDWFLNSNIAITPMVGASYGTGGKPVTQGILSLSVFL